MRNFLGAIVLACGLFLSSCSLDLAGLFYSQVDVDGRFQEQQALAEVNAFTSTNLPFSFVFISDSHVYQGIQNVNFAKLKTKLIGTDQAVFHGGDIVQNGNNDDLALAKQGLASLGITYYAMPGNHDLYYGGWKNYKTVFGRSSYTFAVGPVRVIVLDSASGSIGAYQKQWLERTLSSRTETYCIVITHINVYNFQGTGISQFTDENEIAYLMHLFERKGVNYSINGHVHVQNDTTISGVRYLSVADFRDSPTYLRVTVTSSGISGQFH